MTSLRNSWDLSDSRQQACSEMEAFRRRLPCLFSVSSVYHMERGASRIEARLCVQAYSGAASLKRPQSASRCATRGMVLRPSVEGKAKTGERSMETPPNVSNDWNWCYYTTKSGQQAHRKCPRADMRLKKRNFICQSTCLAQRSGSRMACGFIFLI